MEQQYLPKAILEKRPIRNGVEMPIECLTRSVIGPEKNRTDHKPHYHNYIEFLFGLDSCDVDARIAGQTVHFGTGDLLVINASVAHDFDHKLPKNRYLCIKVLPEVIYFSENPMYDVKYVVPFLQHNLNPYCLFSAEDLQDSDLSTIFHEMLRCWRGQEYGYEIALKSLFLQVFIWIIRRNRQNGHALMEPSPEVSYENIILIQRSVEYINQNFAEVNVATAAAHINMSYSYYSRLFRRVVGKKFHEYLTTVRINEAERLLLSTDLSITEIGLSAGFSTGSHFIDTFKKHRGKTPKQYRSCR